MSKDCRTSFIKTFEASLANALTEEQLHQVVDIAIRVLGDYEITDRCTDLAPLDTENGKAIKRYCACLFVDGKSEKTIYQYRRSIQKLSDFLGKPFTKIGAYDIRYFLACEKMRGLSNRSLENTRANLSAFFSMASSRRNHPQESSCHY